MYDREIYFDAIRQSLFEGALTQQNVDGQSVILAVWEHGAGGTPMTDERWLAYMLATTYHETAYRMWPITEQGGAAYLQGKDYWPYVGRGFVQLTWEANYDKASSALGLIDDRDLVAHPELALDSLIATRVMFRGMAEGWFTGKKLGQYFDADTDDPVNARQIINGNDRDTTIAGYHDLFLMALREAWIETAAPPIAVSPVVLVNVQADPGVAVQVLVNGEPLSAAAAS